MLMSKVEDRICVVFEMKSMTKTKINVTDLIQEFERFAFDENDLVSKSPMRTHEYNHSSKPYGHPHRCSTSKYVGGITKVVEVEEPSRNDQQTTQQFFQPPLGTSQTDLEDVDIQDVDQWLNMCNRNPQVINEFIADINKELNVQEVPVQQGARSFTTLQQYKSDGLSICSNSSSQISSPAQSPSEHNVTSPESFTCEENSLYNCMSPIIPSLECMNFNPGSEKTEKIETFSGEGPVLKYSDPCTRANPNLKANSVRNIPVCSPENMSPNIGTLMLKLAADTYENTIDLSQFARTMSSEPNFTYTAVEKELLDKKLNLKAKQSAWARISQLDADSLGKGDKEGDTQLMILLVSEKFTLEYIYVIVERLLKENPSYLSLRNELNQDALYLAALTLKREPLVASYIAEALIRGEQDVNKKYEEGNTILHCLAKKGDTHAKVLERLVRLRNRNNAPAFDINRKNNRGYTPLHIACEFHRLEDVRTYETVKVLLENGADCTEKDYIDENTPVHTLINESCDTEILKTLLRNSCKFRRKDISLPTTIPNRQGNTVLHLACRRNSLDVPVQKEVIEILLHFGAMRQLKNINGCVPSVLVDTSRKQEIKSCLRSFRQK